MRSKIKMETENSYLGPWNQSIVDTSFLTWSLKRTIQMNEIMYG